MQNSQKVNEWINQFVQCKLIKVPNDENYELKVFDSFQAMHEKIIEKNNEVGLSRVVSTFDYEHKKDGSNYYVEEKGYKLPWNSIDAKISWAEGDTVYEVGSIYTIQGFDLNYVGVVIGPSIYYDKEKKTIEVDISKYKDSGAFAIPQSLKKEENIEEIKKQIILNSLNVLMKRGIKGLYIYASDNNLRDVMMNNKW